jgi:hypothetical protein
VVDGYPPSPTTTASMSPTLSSASSRRSSVTPRRTATRADAHRRDSKRARRSTKSSGQKRGTSSSDDNPEKKFKERAHRAEFKTIDYDEEDASWFYTGYEGSTSQSSGNGNRSGLQYDKRDNRSAQAGLLNHFLHEELLAAYYHDIVVEPDESLPTVNRVRAKNNALMHRVAKATSVLKDTLIEEVEGDTQCTHDGNESKPCSVHPGQPHFEDWRACRRHRRGLMYDTRLKVRIADFKQQRLQWEGQKEARV